MSEPSLEILEGKVVKIAPYGAFVELSDGRSGMVHISEISYEYIRAIEDYLKVGDQVKVVFLETRNGKLSFSIKRAQPGKAPAPRAAFGPNRFGGRTEPQRGQREDRRCAPQRPRGNFNRGSQSEPSNFEDMLSRFKQTSEEKLSSLKKVVNTRYGSGRRGSGRR